MTWLTSTIERLQSQLLDRPGHMLPHSGRDELLARAGGWGFYVGLVVVLLAIVSSFATYLILTGLTPIIPTHDVVVRVMTANIVLLAGLIAVVGWQVAGLLKARRRQAAGARLHVRIVALFSIIAVLPAIILAVFASSSLNRALDRLFSEGTERIIEDSMSVARAYMQEHGQVIRSDIVAMANDVEGFADLYATKPTEFQAQLFGQARLRNLPLAFILDKKGKVLVAAELNNTLPFNRAAVKQIRKAASGDVVIVPPARTNQVGALKQLSGIPDAYLYVSRTVSGTVLDQLRATEESVRDYRELNKRREGTELSLGLMYTTLALTLLLSSVWAGMWFANQLVAPIRRLITAAQDVSRGNLDVQVPVRLDEGDLGHLSNIFNRMTGELRKQRADLVNANQNIDQRRRFTEAVLSGVSAGVLGLSKDGLVTIANPSALRLLGRTLDGLVGRELAAAVPEFGERLAVAMAQSKRDRLVDQVDLTVAGTERNFALQVTRETGKDSDYGFVVTFDDITELVNAQRSSAWSDVARRIAHEIKNPLTPIQLSAERLRRKYGPMIKEDREVFDRCTETIIRQVGDLGRMVDEFSSFARMPKPVMEPQDLRELVKESAFLFQVSNPEIAFKVAAPDAPIVMPVDRRLLGQALTNLVKNATEAVAAYAEQNPEDTGFKGRVEAAIAIDEGKVIISVMDNGVGLPKKDRSRLVEPYVTTRAKGTGIGLAVVQKVTEQHGGQLRLEDAPESEGFAHGAAIRMVLPLPPAASGARAPERRGQTGQDGDGARSSLAT
ncbi:MAG: PAS domain-containing sensor histidine kinase [Hyphomicrobiaceae bacterium]